MGTKTVRKGQNAISALVKRLVHRPKVNAQNYAHYEKVWVDKWFKK